MKKTIQRQEQDIFDEYKRVSRVTGTTTMADFTQAVADGQVGKIIAISEVLQEKKLVHLCDAILKSDAKVVLIAGPSSSGKTTFSKRLSLQLMASGRIPHPISLDDYYVNRVDTPLDENGEYDYETLYALNLTLFNEQLQKLIDGEEVELPRYDFPTGKSILRTGNFLRLGEEDILVIEGIHGLNPELTSKLHYTPSAELLAANPNASKDGLFRVFVSPMTGLQTGEVNGRHTYTPPVDNRLLRRIIRDMKQRNTSAQSTIHRWASVRAGEEKWIYPFYEKADHIFNTALYYELGVIKPQAEAALKAVPTDSPEYATAERLLSFLKDIPVIPEDYIPSVSLLREFLGGSVFE